MSNKSRPAVIGGDTKSGVGNVGTTVDTLALEDADEVLMCSGKMDLARSLWRLAVQYIWCSCYR